MDKLPWVLLGFSFGIMFFRVIIAITIKRFPKTIEDYQEFVARRHKKKPSHE